MIEVVVEPGLSRLLHAWTRQSVNPCVNKSYAQRCGNWLGACYVPRCGASDPWDTPEGVERLEHRANGSG